MGNITTLAHGFYNKLDTHHKRVFLAIIDPENSEALEIFRDQLLSDYSETVQKVLAIVEQVWQFEPGTLKQGKRFRAMVEARAQYYKVMTLFTVCSYEYIAGQVGKDHSTICHAINTGWEVYKKQKNFTKYWEIVRRRCMDEVFNQTEINQNQ